LPKGSPQEKCPDDWIVLGRVDHLHTNDSADEAMVFYKGKVAGVETSQ
jgi:flavin reductase (DIM6/NTAB) family NADH-FMN oxidoreductase RutF